jgi:hypothetical protein
VQDPHVQELLLKETTTVRVAAREKLKLTQLEINSNTQVYAGCRPEDSSLKLKLNILQQKSKFRWSDISGNKHFKFLQKLLPKGDKIPTSLEEAKQVACPLNLPHVIHYACINDCIIYRNDHADETICLECNVDRYKKSMKAPQKVVWFPLVRCLKRYFTDVRKRSSCTGTQK